MYFSKISGQKSQTVGWTDSSGKPHYRKVEFFSELTLNEGDNEFEGRDRFDNFVDEYFINEKDKLKKK